MSKLAAGEDIKYSYVKVRILSCSQPTWWYADKVGQVVEAQKRTYIKDGQVTGASYWAKAGEAAGKDVGYNGSLGEVVEL